MTRPIEALISLANLQHNFAQARALTPGAKIMAVVKANAYGHGAIRVAGALGSLADAFGVASLEEAVELRNSGIDSPIVLLSGVFGRAEIREVARYGLGTVIHSVEQLQILLDTTLPRPVDVWLKLDTGMHRLGFTVDAFCRAAERLRAAEQVGNLTFISHLACADDPPAPQNQRQLARFQTTLAALELRADESLSLANSAALLTRPDMHFDWVRPGVMLYGVNPLSGNVPLPAGVELRPVMTLRSRIIALQTVAGGEAVGYGEVWRAPGSQATSSRIAVVAAGYGDGYPRHASNGCPVLVNGKAATVAGRVSMDLLTVDLGDNPTAKIGDAVTLWGEGLPVERIAEASETIAYELLTGVNQRVKFSDA
ncbi:MAG: alanine racemase [Gammaproteobacteria bacterium]|nr:alanine racemase [Gammaproteobacteria bacterium]MBQ0839831.1 alanine racemase [Gammaproteobacteria bacterium]